MQPSVSRDEKGFAACGVTVVAVVRTGAEQVDTYSFSLVADGSALMGMIKAGKFRSPLEDFKRARTDRMEIVSPAPIRFWIGEERDGFMLVPISLAPSENSQGFLLGGADFAATYRQIVAIQSGKPMHFVARYMDEELERVIAFTPQMGEGDKATLSACFEGLRRRLQADAKR